MTKSDVVTSSRKPVLFIIFWRRVVEIPEYQIKDRNTFPWHRTDGIFPLRRLRYQLVGVTVLFWPIAYDCWRVRCCWSAACYREYSCASRMWWLLLIGWTRLWKQCSSKGPGDMRMKILNFIFVPVFVRGLNLPIRGLFSDGWETTIRGHRYSFELSVDCNRQCRLFLLVPESLFCSL